METRVSRGQAREDRVTGAIENVTSQAPSSPFPWLGNRVNGSFSSSKDFRKG
jgi:hypothetical protein